jgi:hypothetical protein
VIRCHEFWWNFENILENTAASFTMKIGQQGFPQCNSQSYYTASRAEGTKVEFLTYSEDKSGMKLGYTLQHCFSTVGPWPGTGPWHQLYRAARGLRKLQYATRFH